MCSVLASMRLTINRFCRDALRCLAQRGNYAHRIAIRQSGARPIALAAGLLLGGMAVLAALLMHVGASDSQLWHRLTTYLVISIIVAKAVRPDTPAQIVGQFALYWWRLIGGEQTPTARLARSETDHALARARADGSSIRATAIAAHASAHAVAILVARLHAAHVCTSQQTLPSPRLTACA